MTSDVDALGYVKMMYPIEKATTEDRVIESELSLLVSQNRPITHPITIAKANENQPQFA